MIRLTAKEFYDKFSILHSNTEMYLPGFTWGNLSTKEQLDFLLNISIGKIVLEIGTFTGLTTYNLSKVAKEVTTLDIDNRVTDKTGYNTYILGEHFTGSSVNITQIICDTKTYDFNSLGKFDIVFVDGEHTYKGCINDFTKSLEVLNPGGIIVIDDYDPNAIENTFNWDVRRAVEELDLIHTFYHLYDTANFILYRKDI
jgi:predicted O-methyltransferase YrrM